MKKIKASIDTLISNGRAEAKETKEMVALIWESRNKELTIEEKDKIKNQSFDVLRITVLTGLLIIPFSGFLIILLIKFGEKFGVEVLPSSFNKKN